MKNYLISATHLPLRKTLKRIRTDGATDYDDTTSDTGVGWPRSNVTRFAITSNTKIELMMFHARTVVRVFCSMFDVIKKKKMA